MPFLRVKTGPNKGRVFEIKEQVLTIGRDETQTIQVLDQGVSRAHAEIFRIGEACFVRDLDSTNGTFVNKSKVAEETLKNGDELLIGTTILQFEDALQAEAVTGGGGVDEKGGTTTISLHAARQAKPAAGGDITSRNLSAMTEIGRILGSGKELKPRLQRALETLVDVVRADEGYLLMTDPATGKVAAVATIERKEHGIEKRLSRTIVNRVLKACAPTVTTDATLDERFMLSESIVLKKIKSVMAVPVVIREEAQGLLYFHAARGPEGFGVEDLELAASGAFQIALAVGSHRWGEKLQRGLHSTARALVAVMESVDPKGQGHSDRVGDFAAAIAMQLGLPREDVHRIRLAGLLCDIGNLVVPRAAADVPKEQHVFAGEKIVAGIEGAEEILPGVRYHHERADGSGFPYRVKNDQTPILARIVIVANEFDNLCVAGVPAKEALENVGKRGGTEFDDTAVRALLQCHRNGTLFAGARLLEE